MTNMCRYMVFYSLSLLLLGIFTASSTVIGIGACSLTYWGLTALYG